MLLALSSAAAETLALALEALRSWALEAPWLLHAPPTTADGLPADDEDEQCRCLRDRCCHAALVCGAFISYRPSVAPAPGLDTSSAAGGTGGKRTASLSAGSGSQSPR